LSFQAGASVGTGNIELELFMILHFDAFSKDCTRHLSSGSGEGLFECLKVALEYVNVGEWRTRIWL